MKIKIKYGNKLVDATELEFKPDAEKGGEQTSVYAISDGTSMRVRAIVSKIVRIDGEYNSDGTPVYIQQVNNLVSTSSPEGLMQSES